MSPEAGTLSCPGGRITRFTAPSPRLMSYPAGTVRHGPKLLVRLPPIFIFKSFASIVPFHYQVLVTIEMWWLSILYALDHVQRYPELLRCVRGVSNTLKLKFLTLIVRITFNCSQLQTTRVAE